jgi:PAS domain-containing protein
LATNLDWQSADKSMTGLALLEQGEWLRVTLSSIGDAVVTVDANGAVTFLNAAAQSFTGWSQAEAEGIPLGAVFASSMRRPASRSRALPPVPCGRGQSSDWPITAC